jgi:quercetin dioxygenase-like cupin family protein
MPRFARFPCCAVLLAAGCAAQPRVLLPRPPASVDPGELVARAPMRSGDNIVSTLIERGEHASLHLVRIADREQPHVHERYDLTVLLLRGKGTLHLNGRALPMRAGDASFIPKGTPHFFVNQGTDPAAALVSFAPAFDGPDQQPLAP